MVCRNIRWAFNFTQWQPSHSDLLLATSCIQTEEKERLMKFVFKDDFKASLIGRLLMRKFISQIGGLEYNEFRIERDDKDKPVLYNNNSLSFNVSHQGDYTVLAGRKMGGLIGVDVVKITQKKNPDDYFRLMSRSFSSQEWDTIKNDNNPLSMFYRHWCLKESYLKAVGIGITINLQEVSFNVKSKLSDEIIDDTQLYLKGQKSNWIFHESTLDNNHLVAVALNQQSEKIPFEIINFETLMLNSVPLLHNDDNYVKKYFDKIEKKY